MLIAQISDPHVVPEGWLAFGHVATGRLLEAAVDAIRALDPPADGVLLTGDVATDPDEAAYERAAAILARLEVPLWPIPGNHDDRAMMRRALSGSARLPQGDRLAYVVEAAPLRLVCLDSLSPGNPFGVLGDEQIAWLDRTLAAAPERPTLITLHHPPVRTGIDHMDWSMLRDADALEAVVRRHPQVERVLCGHVHRNMVRRWAGTVVQICPGTAHAVKLVLGEGRGPWSMEPPAMLLHYWSAASGLVTHHLPIGDPSVTGRFNDPHRQGSAR